MGSTSVTPQREMASACVLVSCSDPAAGQRVPRDGPAAALTPAALAHTRMRSSLPRRCGPAQRRPPGARERLIGSASIHPLWTSDSEADAHGTVEMQHSQPGLLLVVRGGRLRLDHRDARLRPGSSRGRGPPVISPREAAQAHRIARGSHRVPNPARPGCGCSAPGITAAERSRSLTARGGAPRSLGAARCRCSRVQVARRFCAAARSVGGRRRVIAGESWASARDFPRRARCNPAGRVPGPGGVGSRRTGVTWSKRPTLCRSPGLRRIPPAGCSCAARSLSLWWDAALPRSCGRGGAVGGGRSRPRWACHLGRLGCAHRLLARRPAGAPPVIGMLRAASAPARRSGDR
jgi:hypothetical protein